MDQLFRIVLDVKDADKAAREIKKLKEAYKEVGTSAREIGTATVGGADPFQAATQTPPPVPGATAPGMPATGALPGLIGGGGSILPGMIPAGGAAAMAGARGDVFGAGAGVAGMAGNLFGRLGKIGLKAVPWAIAGAATLGLMGKLAGTEEERIQSIYGGGIGQRLGMGYESARAWSIERGREGTPLSTVQSYMAGLGAAGGGTFNNLNVGRAGRYGIEGGTAGGIQATLQRAGFTGTVDRSVYQVLEKAFGAGRIGTLFQSMGAIIEDSLATGATRATETLKGGATEIAATIAGLSQFGGVSMEGALETYQTMLQKGRGAANVQTPQDIIAFRAARKSGESIFQTRLRMERDPMMAIKGQLGYLGAAYGDDTDKIKESLVRWGYKPSQAEAIVNQREAIALGKEVDKSLFVGEKGRSGDWVAMKDYQVTQRDLLADAAKALVDLKNTLTLGVLKLPEEVAEHMKAGAEAQKEGNEILRAINGGLITRDEILSKNTEQLIKIIEEREQERRSKIPTMMNRTEAMEYYKGLNQ